MSGLRLAAGAAFLLCVSGAMAGTSERFTLRQEALTGGGGTTVAGLALFGVVGNSASARRSGSQGFAMDSEIVLLAPAGPPPLDSDGDGLSDQRELDLGSDPGNPDTDGDGVSDGEEVALGSDPLVDENLQTGPDFRAIIPILNMVLE